MDSKSLPALIIISIHGSIKVNLENVNHGLPMHFVTASLLNLCPLAKPIVILSLPARLQPEA